MYFNKASREIRSQIVFAGPGLCGKTTNLEYLNSEVPGGKLQGVNTTGERTVLFDFLPIGMDSIEGWNFRFNLHTVPGQIQYINARRMVLKAPDCIVFVADSSRSRLEANRYSMDDLMRILDDHNHDVTKLPLVIQYNKRDLPGAVPLEELQRILNPKGTPAVSAIAKTGVGVFETLGVAMEQVRELAMKRLAGAR
jgi:mutual gliding-motility protein MglA